LMVFFNEKDCPMENDERTKRGRLTTQAFSHSQNRPKWS